MPVGACATALCGSEVVHGMRRASVSVGAWVAAGRVRVRAGTAARWWNAACPRAYTPGDEFVVDVEISLNVTWKL
jgi:hypothetical protein